MRIVKYVRWELRLYPGPMLHPTGLLQSQLQAPRPPKYATKNQPITCMTKRAKRARKNWKNYEVLGRSAPKIYVCSYVFGKKNIIGRAQGPRLSGGRSGPGPSLGHHNRSRNPLKSSDSYYCIKIGICFIIFKCHFQF